MLWTPERPWEGQDSFIIGGGASLRAFDFNLLKERNTIGCNDAFRLGRDICKICIFGDASWWHRNKFELDGFENPVFSVAPSLMRLNLPNLYQLVRERNGLHEGNKIGWNFSTGACAVNLAINMGARRVFLLGIDLHLINGQSHWHNLRPLPTREMIFGRFIKGFEAIAKALRLPLYHGIEVIHVTDDAQSPLPFFIKMPFNEFHHVLAQTSLKREEVMA